MLLHLKSVQLALNIPENTQFVWPQIRARLPILKKCHWQKRHKTSETPSRPCVSFTAGNSYKRFTGKSEHTSSWSFHPPFCLFPLMWLIITDDVGLFDATGVHSDRARVWGTPRIHDAIDTRGCHFSCQCAKADVNDEAILQDCWCCTLMNLMETGNYLKSQSNCCLYSGLIWTESSVLSLYRKPTCQ